MIMNIMFKIISVYNYIFRILQYHIFIIDNVLYVNIGSLSLTTVLIKCKPFIAILEIFIILYWCQLAIRMAHTWQGG